MRCFCKKRAVTNPRKTKAMLQARMPDGEGHMLQSMLQRNIRCTSLQHFNEINNQIV